MLTDVPEILQQIIIGWGLLAIVYLMGRKVSEKNKNKFTVNTLFKSITDWNVGILAFLYGEAVFLCILAMQTAEESETSNSADQWLKQHNVLFWFLLACHQALIFATILYEFTTEKRVRKWGWIGLLPVVIQFHVGLFEPYNVGQVVVGLMFEGIIILQLITYLSQVCMRRKSKTRAFWGIVGNLSFIISTLPVFFLATQMKSPAHVLYLTLFFGLISVFSQGKLVSYTESELFTELSVEPSEELKEAFQSQDP